MSSKLFVSLSILGCLSLAGCSQFVSSPLEKSEEGKAKSNKVVLANYSDLNGWSEDKLSQALPAFLKSCTKIAKREHSKPFVAKNRNLLGLEVGRIGHWQYLCKIAKTLDHRASKEAVRQYFEKYFKPYKLVSVAGGLVTGYYEPTLRGSWTKTNRFYVPLYKKPKDLVSVNLGKFVPELATKTIHGRIENQQLVPYWSREEIYNGMLVNRGLDLLWVDSLVDAFFLQIQGSGVVLLPGGERVRVGYAGKNGLPYFAIGRDLIKSGAITKKRMSMDSIKDWLAKNPKKGLELMKKNKSFIFFRLLKGAGPLGAQGVELTPGRSIAVDRNFIPLGVPIWLDTIHPLKGNKPLRRLVVAQDTGGAIRGPTRADFFWGAGSQAGKKAGFMKNTGTMHLLLPRFHN